MNTLDLLEQSATLFISKPVQFTSFFTFFSLLLRLIIQNLAFLFYEREKKFLGTVKNGK